MITGGIDLSVVGICNLVGMVTGIFLKAFLSPGAVSGHSAFIIGMACLLGIIIGMACGLLNGLMIGGIGIPAILATMGSNNLFLGICLIITAGSAVSGIPPQFPALINHEFFGVIPLHLVIFIFCAVLASIMLSRTNFGVRVFLMGTNPKASHFAGLNNFVITIRTYVFSGILCAIAGHLTLAHNNSSRADYGSSLTLQTILICVLGGTSPNGGVGTVLGTVLAIIILQIFSTGLNMFPGVNAFFKDFVWGMVLILVMILQYFKEKFRNKI
jgi:simple sugar transport system permease protein